MPRVKRSKKSPPEGWELIEPTLEELDKKMKEGKNIIYFFDEFVSTCLKILF